MEKKSTIKTKIDEGAVTSALRTRVAYFKEQADSLTLEGVRRVLEKDLGLEEYVLDSHKRFIKQCLQECFDAASNEIVSKSSAETGEEVIDSTKEETEDLSEKKPQSQNELKEIVDKEEMQESPVMGLLAGAGTARKGAQKTESLLPVKALSNETIEKAIRKRAAYFRSNSETITLAGARRLLEEDLKVEKHALDSYRECVKDELDKVLLSPTVTKPSTNGVKNKKRKQVSSEGSSDSDEEVKPKRKTVAKKKLETSAGSKKRKDSAKETKKSSNKPKKPVESISVESDGPKDDGDLSDDGHSQSSTEKPVKKRSEAPSQTYGKRVEHLRSIIKACGMSVPPNVYKRVKEAPESKREAFFIKELEDMLKRDGLSLNPSEKEIKEAKRRKERVKELEGIDLSNIVSSSRRRSTSSFPPPPPKPKVSSPASDEDKEKEEESQEEEDDDNNDEEDEEEEDGSEDEGADDNSDAEESNEEVEDEDSD